MRTSGGDLGEIMVLRRPRNIHSVQYKPQRSRQLRSDEKTMIGKTFSSHWFSTDTSDFNDLGRKGPKS